MRCEEGVAAAAVVRRVAESGNSVTGREGLARLLLGVLASSSSFCARFFFEGVLRLFPAMDVRVGRPWFLEGVPFFSDSGERKSKIPRTRPSFCGVGPIEVRKVEGLFFRADRGGS